MQMQLHDEFSNLKWYGRGPHENYADRKTSADVGIYESSVADQYVPYIRPSENGYKTDTRWLTLTDDNGTGILVSGNPLICFSALNNIHDDFESPGNLSRYRQDAKSANTHTDDIKPRELVNLNVDLGQMGVGGDDSWGARIHPQCVQVISPCLIFIISTGTGRYTPGMMRMRKWHIFMKRSKKRMGRNGEGASLKPLFSQY